MQVKAIPTLRGSAAERFVKMSEENLRRRASVDFSKEAANSYAILKKKEGNKQIVGYLLDNCRFGRLTSEIINQCQPYTCSKNADIDSFFHDHT